MSRQTLTRERGASGLTKRPRKAVVSGQNFALNDGGKEMLK